MFEGAPCVSVGVSRGLPIARAVSIPSHSLVWVFVSPCEALADVRVCCLCVGSSQTCRWCYSSFRERERDSYRVITVR
jgi:hypothetical protein